MRKPLKALSVTRNLTWVLDGISIVSLTGVPEIHPAVFLVVGTLFLARLASKIRFQDGVLTLLLALLAVFSFGSYIAYKIPVVVAMAHGAPIFHALLWFAAVGTRDLWLRVSVGFVELILLSAITAEFYLSMSLLAFTLLASLMISCSLIRNEARTPRLDLGRPKPNREPEKDATLPPSFLVNGLMRSMGLLALTLVIFPFLPRKPGFLGGYLIPAMKVGYTEDVNVTGRKAMSGAGGGEVVMRLQLAEGGDDQGKLLTSIHLGLIRSRILSEFDGVKWRPRPRSTNFKVGASKRLAGDKVVTFEAIREPLSSVIPVPYGARNVWRYSGASFSIPERLASGEWWDGSSSNSTIRFQFSIQDDDPNVNYGTGPADLPIERDLMVPRSVDTPRLRRLAEKILPHKASPRDKAKRMATYFVNANFTTSLSEDLHQDAIESHLKLNSIEKFLLASKGGHCELFATTAAMLLRMSGVPTRLVTGFRLSRGPSAGALLIRSGDAHAWLEYFVPGEGWRVLDPTPRSLAPSGLVTFFRDIYADVSTYWYRYVYSFESGRPGVFSMKTLKDLRVGDRLHGFKDGLIEFVRDHRGGISLALIALLVFGTAGAVAIRRWFPWLYSIRGRVREGPWWIKAERMRMEGYVRTTLGIGIELETAPDELARRGDEAGRKLFRQWLDAYLEERFGPVAGDLKAWKAGRGAELRRKYDAVERRAKTAGL